MRITIEFRLFITCCALSLAGQAVAQTARSGGASAPSAQAMQQLQQLASERTTLQAENARLKADLEAARKERDSLKSAQDAVARRSQGTEAQLAAATGEKARLEGELAGQKQRFDELVQRFRETAATLQGVETDQTSKTQQLMQREQELKVCTDRNSKLYALNEEVLAKLEQQGFWSALLRQEPFTRLKRTQLENLADNYRDAAQDDRVPTPQADR
jgi:chromosome segregation ATPase